MTNIIELKNISKSYHSKKSIKVLKNINFKFKKGKIYSLVGPSGSGKSTLLNLISLIDQPSAGKIKIENHEINYQNKIINDKIRAKKIGIIYQDKNLLSDFTAIENIYLARLSIDDKKDKAIKDSIKMTDDLMKNGINVYFVNLSDEDPSDMGFEKVINLIKETKETSFSDLMRMRLNGKTKKYMEI